MTATERAKIVLAILREYPDGLTYGQIRASGREAKLSGTQTFDAIAKLRRDGVLEAGVAATNEAGEKVYKLKPNTADYTPKPRGSFT